MLGEQTGDGALRTESGGRPGDQKEKVGKPWPWLGQGAGCPAAMTVHGWFNALCA